MSMRIVGGAFKGRILKSPKGQETRPTSQRLRETVFNICQQEVPDADVLDVFAGTGAIGFEALSRGARSVTFLEKSREAASLIQKNTTLLPLDDHQRANVLVGEALSSLHRLAREGQTFDLVYIDPPYGKDSLAEEVLAILGEGKLLKSNSIVLLEEASAFVLPQDAIGCLVLRKKRQVGGTVLFEFVADMARS